MQARFSCLLPGLVLSWQLATVGTVHADPPTNNAKTIEGFWQGDLKVGLFEIRNVFTVTKKPDGTYAGTLDILEEGRKDLVIGKIRFQDADVRFEVPGIKGTYEGKLNAAGSEITGQWKRWGQKQPLVLRRTDKPAVLRRPQLPKRPFPYLEEEVRYENKKAGVRIAGTLTLPRGPGPFPAVLLLLGSGPHDRDLSILGHKSFLVLSDYLTRRGIAVVRVDKRGVGGSTGKDADATLEDLAEDALAGVAFLKGRKEIDAAKIGLIGLSQGGNVAPLAATRSADVAFIVMLAGPGVSGEETILLQLDAIMKADGATEAQIAAKRVIYRKMIDIVKTEQDRAVAQKKLREIFDEGSLIQYFLSPSFRSGIIYDIRPVLKKVRCPVLALNGAKDVQVVAHANLPEITKAFKAGGNPDYTVKELPGLNHIFQSCKTGALSEYGKIEETMAPLVLDLIADWVSKHTADAKKK